MKVINVLSYVLNVVLVIGILVLIVTMMIQSIYTSYDEMNALQQCPTKEYEDALQKTSVEFQQLLANASTEANKTLTAVQGEWVNVTSVNDVLINQLKEYEAAEKNIDQTLKILNPSNDYRFYWYDSLDRHMEVIYNDKITAIEKNITEYNQILSELERNASDISTSLKEETAKYDSANAQLLSAQKELKQAIIDDKVADNNDQSATNATASKIERLKNNVDKATTEMNRLNQTKFEFDEKMKKVSQDLNQVNTTLNSYKTELETRKIKVQEIQLSRKIVMEDSKLIHLQDMIKEMKKFLWSHVKFVKFVKHRT